MANPYEDEGNDSAANGGLLAEMREEIANADESGGGNNDNVSPEDRPPETFEVDAPVGPEPEDEPRLSSKDKRRKRGEDHRRKQAAELSAEKAESDKLRLELAEMRGRVAATEQFQRQAPQQQQGNQWDDAIAEERAGRKKTMKDYEGAVAKYASQKKEMPQEEQEAWVEQNDQHMVQRAKIEMQRDQAAANTPAQQAARHVEMMYPDVMSNPRAKAYAIARHAMRKAVGDGPADDGELTAEVMAETRKQFKLGSDRNPPPPNESQRSSYGRGQRSSTGSGRGSQPRRMTPTKEQREMAISLYKHHTDLSNSEKVQMWVNEVGQDL